MKKIPLSLATNYVSDWDFWCAIRELIQNAIDAAPYRVTMDAQRGQIIIESFDGSIPVSQLLLGNGTKADDEDSIGKFGEGFKLALLILCRQGYGVDIANGVDKWRASLEYSETFQAEHLHITIKEGVLSDDRKDQVSIIIEDVPEHQIDRVSSCYLPDDHQVNRVFGTEKSYAFEVDGQAKLFVGGLFVCNLDNDADDEPYRYSYNFEPAKLELDRDRNAVDTWSLQHEVSMLLVRTGEAELMVELAQDGAPDIRGFAEWQLSYGPRTNGGSEGLTLKEGLTKIASSGFVEQYGSKAYPVNSEWGVSKKSAVIKLAEQKGLKPAVIPAARFNMLDKKSIPVLSELDDAAKFDVIEHLTDLLERNKKHMRSKPRKEIQATIDRLRLLSDIK